MSTIFLFAGAILERAGLAAGFLAALIAIGGFIGRAYAVLLDAKETNIQRQTAVGGLFGLSFGLLVVLADTVFG